MPFARRLGPHLGAARAPKTGASCSRKFLNLARGNWKSHRATERSQPEESCRTLQRMAGVPGLEPRLKESESFVLPITPYPSGPAEAGPTSHSNHASGRPQTIGCGAVRSERESRCVELLLDRAGWSRHPSRRAMSRTRSTARATPPRRKLPSIIPADNRLGGSEPAPENHRLVRRLRRSASTRSSASIPGVNTMPIFTSGKHMKPRSSRMKRASWASASIPPAA